MAREYNGTAAETWRDRLERFEAAGVTVREFCSREDVSQASFYHWRKRLAESESDRAQVSKPAFQALRVTGSVGVLSIELPGGARIEVSADHVDLAHLVVLEVVRAAGSGGA